MRRQQPGARSSLRRRVCLLLQLAGTAFGGTAFGGTAFGGAAAAGGALAGEAPPRDPAAPAASLHYAYTTNLAGNPVGGLRPGQASYTDNHLLTLSLPLDLGLGALRDTSLILSAFDRNGVDLSATAIGNQFTVQQVYGDETLGLYSIRLESRLPSLGGRLKLGRFSSGDDFATWPIYGLAMNNAIDGNPQSLLDNAGFGSFPEAVWGGMAEVAVAEHSSLSVGAFQITDPAVLRYHGLNWAIRPGDGLLLTGQLEHCPGCAGIGWAAQRQERLRSPLPPVVVPPMAVPPVAELEPSYPLHQQRLALGGYWSLSPQSSFDGTASAPSTYGAWLHADRTLWRRSIGGPALVVWGSLTGSPQPSVARLPLFWALGLVRYGLQPSRPQDSAMLALYQGRFSPAYAASANNGMGPGSHETVIELAYRRRLSAAAYLQPDLQLVLQPGGRPIPAALVVGLQAGLSF